MGKTIVAIEGSYRPGRVIDTAVTETLRGVQNQGVEVVRFNLRELTIEFCNNCRACTQEPGLRRGTCIYHDDMETVLEALDRADGVVLASPVNFGTVNALTKRFVERLVGYAQWPWGSPIPKVRQKVGHKHALIITASAAPAPIARVLMPDARRCLRDAARLMGAKGRRSLHLGMVARNQADTLNQRQSQRLYRAGQHLAQRV